MPRRVLLGVPALDGRVTAYHAHSAEETLRACIEQGIEFRTLRIIDDSILPNARNDILAAAVRGAYDDLLFVDADQDWKPEDAIKILSYPVDCIGAPVRKKTDDGEFYNVRTRSGVLTRHDQHPILTAPDLAVGTGFLRLSRRAMAALWDGALEYRVLNSTKPPSRWVFDHRPVDGHLVGEDTMMCDKLRALGIAVWIDPSIICGHVGNKRWAGDFAAWLKTHRIDPDAAANDGP